MKMRFVKQVISCMLMCSLSLGNVLPIMASETNSTGIQMMAAIFENSGSGEIVEEGSCGEGVTYTLDSDGVLTISGEGEIEEQAFQWNEDIQQVIIDKGVTSIGDEAFYYCDGVTSIELSESIISIGDNAFYGCIGLTSIEIPKSVAQIGKEAFSRCSDLASIVVVEENAIYDSRNNCNAIIEKESNTLIVGCKDTKISSGVTCIGDNAFYGCDGLTSIEIPSGVTSIGAGAFASCKGLTSIELPEGVASIGNSAFIYCSNLTSVEIPESVTSIGGSAFMTCMKLTSIKLPSGLTSIGDGMFYECRSLTSIEIPESVTSIGYRAFYDCQGLTNIELPKSMLNIGEGAFYGCIGLTSMEIPSGVTSIGAGVFSYCEELKSIVVVKDNKIYDSRNNCNAIIESSSNKLVAGCKNTEIPESVTSIGDSAFYICVGMTSINIPESVTSIEDSAFHGCSRLTGIEIPESVTNIGDSAFDGCSSLKSINIPDGVTNIGDYTFTSCSLTSIEIPNSVTSIGNSAFEFCHTLTSIIMSEKLTSIGAYAFKGCGLTSIEISESVTSIGDRAFSYCSELTDVYYAGTEEEWKNIVIGEYAIPETVTMHYEYLPPKLYIGSKTVSLSQNTYTYNGKQHAPKVIVEGLVEGTDYEVTYTNNVNVGTATVIITGKGNYTGTVTKTFTIKPAEKTEEKPTEPSTDKPSKVSSLKQKASYSTSAITLTWNKVDGADGYEVYRATSKKGKYVKVATVTKTSYKNTKLNAGKTYYYKVRAYKNADKSKVYGDYSSIAIAGTQTAKPSLKVTAGKKKATLTWKKVTGADGYELQMSTSKKGKFKKIKTVKAKTTKYTKSKLTKGKKYYFRIRTYRTVSGKKIYSGWSAVKSVKIK